MPTLSFPLSQAHLPCRAAEQMQFGREQGAKHFQGVAEPVVAKLIVRTSFVHSEWVARQP